MKKLQEIVDFFKVKKSVKNRQVVDKLYNLKNERIKPETPKVDGFEFDVNKVKFAPKLPELEEAPRGKRGENNPLQ